MKNQLLIIIALFTSTCLIGQHIQETYVGNMTSTASKSKRDYNQNYKLLSSDLIKSHLSENLVYSNYLKENCAQGRVIVKVNVNRFGKFQDLEVMKSPHRAFDSIINNTIKTKPFPKLSGFKEDYTVYVPIYFALK